MKINLDDFIQEVKNTAECESMIKTMIDPYLETNVINPLIKGD